MRIGTLPVGDPIHRYEKCIVVPFSGRRRVLSTCALNGGYQEGLTAVFNNDINPGAGMECRMRAPSYEAHLALTAEALGLDPSTAAGMSTAASMENVAIRTEQSGVTAVTAVVTGGIEVNGGRVGDPASWDEAVEQGTPSAAGTINIMLFFNVDLTPGALARALVTCTEAKTAALQELLAPSRYSMGLATGSGTDGPSVVCNRESEACLTNAGKHSKLGELIGKAVKPAVQEALRRQTGLSPELQHHVLRRIDRFGVTEQSLWEAYAQGPGRLSRAEFSEKLDSLCRQSCLVTQVSLYVHLLDQLQWGLLAPGEALRAGRGILEGLREIPEEGSQSLLPGNTEDAEPGAAPEVLSRMLRELEEALNRLLEEREAGSR